MMHIDQRKEQFSFAYVRAVAVAAGFAVSEPSVDDDSIDLQIASRSKAGTNKSPRLEVQAKCLGAGMFDGASFGYPLKLKNYDDLREPDVYVPRILVVVRVPEAVDEWAESSDDHLLIRHCGYWCTLRGKPAYSGSAQPGNERVTVTLQRDQRFDAEGLQGIMDRIGRGGQP